VGSLGAVVASTGNPVGAHWLPKGEMESTPRGTWGSESQHDAVIIQLLTRVAIRLLELTSC